MPSLQFLIEKSQLTYHSHKDSQGWVIFVPNATLQKHHKNFDIFLGSERYDGFALDVEIILKKITPKNLQWIEKCREFVQQASARASSFSAAARAPPQQELPGLHEAG